MTCLHGLLYAQSKSGNKPQVNQKFGHIYYSADFDTVMKEWPVVSNSENLLIMQEGEYILHRKSLLSPFAAMADLNQQLSAFRMVTGFKIIKGKEVAASMGLILMAQPGGTGGLIFEINETQQYRLRQITNRGYEYLTGDAKSGGWMKSPIVKAVTISNIIEVCTYEKKYDFYLNGSFLLSFIEPAYTYGGFGFVIGPGTMARVDFINLYTDEKNKLADITPDDVSTETNRELDVVALAESIIELRTTINKLQKENENLKLRIESFRGEEKEQQKMKTAYEARIKELDNTISGMSRSFDSLLIINKDLNKYKELLRGNEGGDVVINLSRNLKSEKLKNEELLKENQQLRDSLLIMKNPALPDKSSLQTPTDSKEFVLPKEN